MKHPKEISKELRIKTREALLTHGDEMFEDLLCEIIEHQYSLELYCKLNKYSQGSFFTWISADKDKLQKYMAALNQRNEHVVESVLQELRHISFSDVREVYDEQGRLKNPADWPDNVARIIAGVETTEMKGDESGEMKKLKLWDKLKAIELLGKNLKMFAEQHHLSGKVTLEDLIVGANGTDSDPS